MWSFPKFAGEHDMAEYMPSGHRQDPDADLMDLGSYDSNHLLDSVLDQLHLPDDAALARAIDVDPALLADVRDMRRQVDAALLIRLHEMTDISITGLRNILGDRRRRTRLADGEGNQ
jgi:hypothetical protein